MGFEPKHRTFVQSFLDAFHGVGDCLKTERNMRVHLTLCVFVLFFASHISLTRGEMACLILTIGAVMAMEALNTSIEKLCDFTQKNLNPRIRVIKDLAAGAVVISAVAAALVGVVILFRPELLAFIKELIASPVHLCIFLLTLGIALVFVIAGPEKIGGWISSPFRKNRKNKNEQR